jgi:hypothetical protein
MKAPVAPHKVAIKAAADLFVRNNLRAATVPISFNGSETLEMLIPADRTARLMAEMPEVGRLSNKKIPSLPARLRWPAIAVNGKVNAPYVEDDALSGKLAAGVSRHNADFGAFRQRLAAAGKPKKVIRIALAHKLLVRLDAKARDVLQQLREAPPAAVLLSKNIPAPAALGESGKRSRVSQVDSVHIFSTTTPTLTRLTKHTVASLPVAPAGPGQCS